MGDSPTRVSARAAGFRAAAKATDLPVDKITKVTVLDPYFHH
jgi:hypothetical protein